MRDILKKKTTWVGIAFLALAVFGGEMPEFVKDNLKEILTGLMGAGWIAVRAAIAKGR